MILCDSVAIIIRSLNLKIIVQEILTGQRFSSILYDDLHILAVYGHSSGIGTLRHLSVQLGKNLGNRQPFAHGGIFIQHQTDDLIRLFLPVGNIFIAWDRSSQITDVLRDLRQGIQVIAIYLNR